MQLDFLIYIGTFFGTLCYINDFFSLYETCKTLYNIECIDINKSVNIFSIRIRVCVMTANGCFLVYYIIHSLYNLLYCYILFFTLDWIILITRTYYFYIFNKNLTINNIVIVENPIHDNMPL